MTGLRIPESWIEEHCRTLEPGLFSACRAEQLQVCLSYGPKAKWLAEYGPDEVARELATGMLVEGIDGNDGTYYRLTGPTLDVFAQPRVARDSGVWQGYVTSVKPARGLGRGETVRPRGVRLAVVWDEEPCDLAELEKFFAEGLRVVQRRRSARDRARRGLARTGLAARPRSDLHAMVRRHYQPLLQMLELLEQRSKEEGTVRGRGVVVGEDEVQGQPVLWLRLETKAGFAEGRTVAVTGPGIKSNLRVRGVEFDDGNQLLALAAPRQNVAADTRLRLEQQGRFALGKHSGAMRSFLDERIEGDWEHLALLLCDPEQLPVVDIPRGRWYFDDRLNDEQRAAVDGAVGSPHVFHVQGPPGTGKSTVITEVVRQLVARGERVLLLAPMHVAVDEVLRRLVGKPGILALRISWDQSRVAPELREYLPEQVARTYLKQVRRPATSQAGRWRAEIDQLRGQHEAVDGFLSATARHRQAIDAWHEARAAHGRWRTQLAESLDAARADHGEAEHALAYFASAIPPAADNAQALLAKLQAVPVGRRIWARVQGVFGATNEIAQLSAASRQADAEYRRLSHDQRAWAGRHVATSARIHGLEAERATAEQTHQATIDRCRAAVEQAQADTDAAVGRLRALTGHDPTGVAEADLARWRDQLVGEMTRREHRIRLEQRWFELSGLVGGSEEAMAEQVDADLRRSANLIACTTTGVTKDLGDSDFDTLIVDEASRVVDSEFLIGAVRARRWVLVGDEHQLPPYVEPDDEHHLHALSALQMVERRATQDISIAVDHLAKLWTEDEDLHQFRTDVVRRTAENLGDSGAWQRVYRSTFDAAWRRLRELNDDAEQTLLSAMLAHLVRSLFERSVVTAPPQLRQRLVVQRRMIEPIAALVKEPVYHGAYETPEVPEVTPLPYGGTNTPVVFVDTSVYGAKARDRQVGTGVVNDLEAKLIAQMCRSWEQRLRQSGGEKVSVSVLTFYRRQATEIRAQLGRPPNRSFRALDFGVIDAIDKIQGQESDLVFVSFCRTFPGNGRPSARYGRWLQDIRRLNVACTRARRALVLVGHAPTLRKLNGVPAAEEFYRNLFSLLAERSDMEIAKGVG
ncbi:DEAD/DEAH box helicase [Allorhizocola rhizosphaerae]|uniref:DEAD/DEAH box helicase n=1 Tax=Allorhizocola rhizosphaerae TaxID=1872709 RepID=UPI000E3EC9BA|nr:AAA domain-containing protein [Allorhizocola rhizosphaerae]